MVGQGILAFTYLRLCNVDFLRLYKSIIIIGVYSLFEYIIVYINSFVKYK